MKEFPAELGASLHVSRETIQRLNIYEAVLTKWMPYKNLISPATLSSLWTRHFADSLQLFKLAPDARIWVDIGAGAGFPGLAIACALVGVPGAVVHLIDSDNRKCAFLREAARETGAPAIVHHSRAEDIIASFTNVDVVTARAVADLGMLLHLTGPLIDKGALALFPKGREYGGELTRVDHDPNREVSVVDSLTARDAKVLVIKRLSSS